MNNHQQEVFESLKSMGFEQQLIENAWNSSEIKTIEGLINWIDSNPQQINLPKLSQDQQQNDNNQETTNQQQKSNKNVDKLVKKEIVEALQQKGYSTLVSEKAALMSGNKTEQEALEWIEQHKDDKDFEDPIEVETKPQLTKEEARRQAKELQAKIRKEAEEIEKQKALDAEKRRIRMGKELSHAQRVMKEQQEKIAIKEFVKNKKKLENEKEAMLRKLEQDKIERFGKDYVAKKNEVVKKTKVQEFNDLYDKMYKIYRMGQIRELQTCLKTLTIYISNILKNPQEQKYQKINSNNANFQKRVGDIIGSQKILELAGFKLDNNGYFILNNMDQKNLNELNQELQKKVQKLSQM